MTHAKRHILTVSVEDYFHATAAAAMVGTRLWSRLEGRVEANTHRALDLLDESGAQATFFTLGWVAEQMPELVAEISRRGHEVASKGYLPQSAKALEPEAFRDDAIRSKEVIEAATGVTVLGHRLARGTLGVPQLWALETLARAGFAYDSSVYPRARSIAGQPWRRFVHQERFGDQTIWEVPLSSWTVGPWHVPASGGNVFRQMPEALARGSVELWHQRYDSPFNLFFHVWELDPDLPRLTSASPLARLRLYRNLHRTAQRVRETCARYTFVGIARYLELQATEPVAAQVPRRAASAPSPQAPKTTPVSDKTPVTIVVPFFNEEATIPYFMNTLAEIDGELDARYQVRYVFVDDASTDETFSALQEAFGGMERCQLVQHPVNKGVAAAITTGIGAATTEIVCSMDCDCTYDPAHLMGMIPLLEPGVDMVTASPYHPDGEVVGVPPWRLILSQGLSRLYGLVLTNRLHTFTSCCRVYRRSAMSQVDLEDGGFLGVAEMLIKLDLAGGTIVEYPAVLESRLFGESKMKLARTIRGHLGMLRRLTAGRMHPTFSPRGVPPLTPPHAVEGAR